MENEPRATKRCLRSQICKFIIPEFELLTPVDVRTFRRTLSYTRLEEKLGCPEDDMKTITMHCAVKACAAWAEVILTETEPRPNAVCVYDTDTCLRR